MLVIDKYAYTNRLAGKPPLEKLILALLTLVVGLIADSPLISALIFLVMMLMLWRAEIPIRYFLTLLVGPLCFTLLGIITILVKLQWGPPGIWGGTDFYHFSLVLSTANLKIALNLMLKVLGSLSCLYFLCLTTPVVELIAVLKKLKVPLLLVELMSLVYKSIFVLMETAEAMVISQSSRLGYQDLKEWLSFIPRAYGDAFCKGL